MGKFCKNVSFSQTEENPIGLVWHEGESNNSNHSQNCTIVLVEINFKDWKEIPSCKNVKEMKLRFKKS